MRPVSPFLCGVPYIIFACYIHFYVHLFHVNLTLAADDDVVSNYNFVPEGVLLGSQIYGHFSFSVDINELAPYIDYLTKVEQAIQRAAIAKPSPVLQALKNIANEEVVQIREIWNDLKF